MGGPPYRADRRLKAALITPALPRRAKTRPFPSFVLGSKQCQPPHHLGDVHRRGATYSSHRAPPNVPVGKEPVSAGSGLAGEMEVRLRRFSPVALLDTTLSILSSVIICVHVNSPTPRFRTCQNAHPG
jgi:hypothetical protein